MYTPRPPLYIQGEVFFMAENSSSSSSSSQSSSSSGEIQSVFALLEAVETAIINVANMQAYSLGDVEVKRARMEELMASRKELLREVAQKQRRVPLTAQAIMSNNVG